jgi:hypothetical protein
LRNSQTLFLNFFQEGHMKKSHRVITSLSLALAFLLHACGNNVKATEIMTDPAAPTPSAEPTITFTPDPCGTENIEAEVQEVHKYMREFDDASTLAASRPREQLADSISDLQRIRREAEDLTIPACLTSLKTFQISHMNAVINTLIAFMGGSDQQVVDQNITIAREQHDRYTLELARLLGLTVVPASPVLPLASETPSP